MIVKKQGKKSTGKIVIDLDGPQGNAIALLGLAQNFCRQMKFSKEQTSKITGQMQSSDYANLVRTFDRYFGSLVKIEHSFDLDIY
jgi:hypothetical protein